MGAVGGRARLLRSWPGVVGAALLLAGCASMPSSGEVRKVGQGQHADVDSQVRVFPSAPHRGESASDIVNGFMEATTSDETDFATAEKYLTKALQKTWDPTAKITVLTSSAQPKEASVTGSGRKESSVIVDLTGTKAAVVDAKHTYTPEAGAYDASFRLVKENNEWRIDDLDDGLVISQQDFSRIYHPVNMYYFASLGPDTQRAGGADKTLVADPVFLRNQSDSVVSTVSTLLGGPSKWLAPVVSTAVPKGVRLYDKAADRGVTLDDSQHLKVRLDATAQRLGGEPGCTRLAAQLFTTVQDQSVPKLAAVDLAAADGRSVCSLGKDQAAAYGAQNLVGSSERQYYIGAQPHRLLALSSTGSTSARPVNGPFGETKANLEAVAVGRDERIAAGVRENGRQLVVGSLIEDGPFAPPVLTSKVKGGLSAPSWDGFDDLWVADRDPSAPRVVVLRNGGGDPIPVSVEGLTGRVEALRVASDGVRIAMLVQEDGLGKLKLGRIERSGTQQHPTFEVKDLRTLTPEGEGVTSVSWAGPSRLVVLDDNQSDRAEQIQYVNTDGWATTPFEGISQAASVAASEDLSRPLLASFDHSVYRLPPDSTGKRVEPKGDDPVYPG
ncbi:LpqB family beta-propeller domain-containing protein [Actinacidiphila alni]|uniref:LpqB family beta-propeller domain-containing protein n=1 Tax=Actinacidiphila alni TaxID=380248 RepID=UPI003455C657